MESGQLPSARFTVAGITWSKLQEETTMSQQPTFEQFTAVRSIHAATWSPDGTRSAYLADTSGRLQLWMQPAGGGNAVQLTALPDRRVTGFRWSPDGSRIAFLADHL